MLATLEKVPFVDYTQASGVKYNRTLIFNFLTRVSPKIEVCNSGLEGSDNGRLSDQNAPQLTKIRFRE